jgi:hypothetical protein
MQTTFCIASKWLWQRPQRLELPVLLLSPGYFQCEKGLCGFRQLIEQGVDLREREREDLDQVFCFSRTILFLSLHFPCPLLFRWYLPLWLLFSLSQCSARIRVLCIFVFMHVRGVWVYACIHLCKRLCRSQSLCACACVYMFSMKATLWMTTKSMISRRRGQKGRRGSGRRRNAITRRRKGRRIED